MTTHPLELSEHIIETGEVSSPPNRVTNELSELTDRVALIESFSHSLVIDSGEGLVVFDTSHINTGAAVVDAMRSWRSEPPVDTIVYTHGHVDHVGGSGAFAAEAIRQGHGVPAVIAHECLPARFDRYRSTNGWNVAINRRQFGGTRDQASGLMVGRPTTPRTAGDFLPADVLEATELYEDTHRAQIGDLTFEINHARGETDDHSWTWVPELSLISAGDLFIWNFPNAGNPQKVQRFPSEWSAALRAMAAKPAELFVPAHGLPIAGHDRITSCLTTVADVLDRLVAETVAMMNAGAMLDEIIHTVKVPESDLAIPYLRPLYDEPEFVVRNVWRLYGGWWNGNPAELKPAPESELAAELATLAGGALRMAERANEVAASGDLRLACHLIEIAGAAAPNDPAIHTIRADIYSQRRAAEASLMSKGIFSGAAKESQAILDRN